MCCDFFAPSCKFTSVNRLDSLCPCGSGGALVDVGEAMRRLAEVKDSLDIDVKQNFIDPLQGLCDKDLREIQVR